MSAGSNPCFLSTGVTMAVVWDGGSRPFLKQHVAHLVRNRMSEDSLMRNVGAGSSSQLYCYYNSHYYYYCSHYYFMKMLDNVGRSDWIPWAGLASPGYLRWKCTWNFFKNWSGKSGNFVVANYWNYWEPRLDSTSDWCLSLFGHHVWQTDLLIENEYLSLFRQNFMMAYVQKDKEQLLQLMIWNWWKNQ